MPAQVDFYILSAESGTPGDYAVRLAEKVYRRGLSLLILVATDEDAGWIDEKLWQQEGFLPHSVLPAKESEMIRICTVPTMQGSADVLVNLAGDLPPRPDDFSRIAEIVPAHPSAREQSRRNYRRYQEKGYAIKTHQIGGQAR